MSGLTFEKLKKAKQILDESLIKEDQHGMLRYNPPILITESELMKMMDWSREKARAFLKKYGSKIRIEI